MALAGWLSYLLVHSVADTSRSLRPQLESGTLLFVVAGLGFRILAAPRVSSAVAPVTSHRSWFALLPIMWGLAIVLYWPALSVGLLADDFILAQHAGAWNLGPVAAQLFRPLPLALWSVLLHLGAGAVGIHLLNIFVHGTNAYLTARVVAGWIEGRWWPALAGVVFLIWPLAPEAVVWGAGVFDVTSTTLLLSAIVVARRYDDEPAFAIRILMAVLVLAALLCKETAAIGPLLIGIDARMRRALSKRLIQDLLLIAVVIGLIMGARMHWLGSPALPPVTRYRLQRVLFDSFGSLAVPWHSELFRRRSLLFLFSGLSATLLLTLFFLMPRSSGHTQAIIAGALWVLASVLPVVPLFYVSPALEGSRYLYLSTVGWAAILMTAASVVHGRSPRLDLIVAPIVVLTMAFAAYGTRVHLQPWLRASALRDRVLAAAAANNTLRDCDGPVLHNLPQSVQGAYLFLNGAREAFADVGLHVRVGESTGPCAFRWNSTSSQFEPVQGP